MTRRIPNPQRRNVVLSTPIPVADEPGFYEVEVTDSRDGRSIHLVGLTAQGATDVALLYCQLNGLTPLQLQVEQ